MRYEIGTKSRSAVIDESGVHITEKRESRFVAMGKIVAVSVKKPGFMNAVHIFLQTAADSSNPLASRNTIPFQGSENYELACKIKEEVERLI